MFFALTIFIISLAGLAALFAFKIAEVSGKETLLQSLSHRGDELLSRGRKMLTRKSKEVHHIHIKPALKKAGEAAREAIASGCEWCIREMRQAARLLRGKEPTAPPGGSVSVFLKQMLDFKNGKKDELEK
ncbi:MAG: hypothetical protein UX81_C0026G0006 [Parcubacteria group bacterium GW2011_GWA2_47_12]|nr:MAG: hypothetical protein UX81_C0026G0006 [Parcubacteria group bacterium GW2011_GWA2_47_12]